ncbi:MAG: hypothetical protein ACOCRU_00010 [bacterium]
MNFVAKNKRIEGHKEDYYQAKMIAEMSNNNSIKNLLGVDEPIFIASEFILHEGDKRGGNKIDIIAYDGNRKLFFFELKKPYFTDDPIKQVKSYLERYGKENKKEMLEVLKTYPVHPINQDIEEVEGYAVYGYSEEINIDKSY